MKIIARKQSCIEILSIVIGTAFMAFSINYIFEPMNLVTGGFTGISIIVKSLTSVFFEEGIPIWFTNMILNVPIFIVGIRIKGFKFIRKTILATISLSVWLYLIPYYKIINADYVLTAVFGGCIMGVGIGLVFRANATTGGTDMLAALIHHYYRGYSIVQIMQVIDAAIVLAGAYLFGINLALYATITIFIVAKVSDGVIEGYKYSKVVFIISEAYEEISDAIICKLKRGVTALNSKGMYSGREGRILFCAVSKKEIVYLKELVMSVDNNAFVIVSDAREVLGEGFLEYK